MRRMTTILVVCGVLVGLCGSVDAGLTPGAKLAAEALIKQFNAREFTVRQQAVDRLIVLGPDVVPLVQKTLAETYDAEVKLRCQMVLTGIAKKHGIDIKTGTPTPAAKKFGLEASKVTLKLKDAELDEILQALADQSGNRPLPMPAAWEMKPITLQVTDMPYWQALDKVCDEAGLIYIPDYQAGGLKLIPKEDVIDVSAYAGPFVVKLDSATKRKYFRPQNRRFQRDGLSYSLTWFWEDRLAPIRSTASVTTAAAPGGEAMELAATTGRGAMMGGGRRGRGGRTLAVGSLNVNISEIPKDLQTVGEISGVAKLTMGDGEQTLKIEDVLAGGEKSGTVGNTTITVASVNRRNTWAWLQLRQTVDGKPAPAVAYPAGSPYGFYLVDPNGERHRGRSWGGGAIRRMNLGGRAGGRRDRGGRNPGQRDQGRRDQAAPAPDARDAGQAVDGGRDQAAPPPGGRDPGRRDQRRRDRGGPRAQVGIRGGANGNVQVQGGVNAAGPGTLNVSFSRLPEIQGAWTLLCVIPEKTTEKEFPFTFKDVPLP